MTARAAQCGYGVHGFAMNPCDSSPFSTAPYYREARVTFSRRQTACEIAALLRSPHCGVPRETGITAHFYKMSRAAADDRSSGKSYSNSKRGNAALWAVQSASIAALRAARLQWETPFFWTVTPPVFFLGKENGGCAPAARRRHIPPRCARKILCSCYRRNLIFPQD